MRFILRRDGIHIADVPTDSAGTLNGAFLYAMDFVNAVLDGVVDGGA